MEMARLIASLGHESHFLAKSFKPSNLLSKQLLGNALLVEFIILYHSSNIMRYLKQGGRLTT